MIIIVFLIFGAVGIFSICASVFDWDWYWEQSRSQDIVKLFGRDTARIINAVIGALLIAAPIVWVALN